MDWSPDQIAELTRLWGEGLTATEIAKRMGISKNAVIGKAHRRHLPGRPSPIKRYGRRVGTASYVPSAPKAYPVKRATPKPSPPPVAPRVVTLSKTQTCQNLSGDRPHGGWTEDRKCGRPAIEGKPWCPACAEHFIAGSIPASQLISEEQAA